MKALLLSVALGAMVFASPVFAADAAKGSLDGKTFAVVVKTADGAKDDTLSFKDGKVECALSKTAGYPAAAYTTKVAGAVTTVTAELKNDKGDSRKIAGTVTGDKISGTIDATEGGKTSKMTFGSKPAAAAAKPAAPAPAPKPAAPVTK